MNLTYKGSPACSLRSSLSASGLHAPAGLRTEASLWQTALLLPHRACRKEYPQIRYVIGQAIVWSALRHSAHMRHPVVQACEFWEHCAQQCRRIFQTCSSSHKRQSAPGLQQDIEVSVSPLCLIVCQSAVETAPCGAVVA